jgi:non-ribosomal peptide synthetase component E (peptide arylation enzyme)
MNDLMAQIGPRIRLPGVAYQTEERLAHYAGLGVLTQETLASAFRDVARRHAARIAVSEPGRLTDYATLDALSDRAAAAFLGLGLQPMERVVFQIVNSLELIVCFFGCLKAGLIPICTLTAHRRHEIAYLGRHAQARAHIVHGDDAKFDMVGFAREMRAEIPSMAHTIVVRGQAPSGEAGFTDLAALLDGMSPEAARARLAEVTLDPYQVALFQLSGGTSGVPKIIPRFNNEYLYSIRTVIARQGLDAEIVAFTPNPMLHNAPMLCYFGGAFFVGGEVMISPGLDAPTIGPLLAARRPNWLAIPIPVLLRLKEAGWLDRIDFSHVRGGFVPAAARQYSALLGGVPMFPLFGMTEGILSCCCATDPATAIDGTVGQPLSPHDEVVVVEPGTQTPVPDGVEGELLVRGPCTIRGYYDAADRNLEAFTPDGFYRSGDLMKFVVIEGRRFLVFCGRLKDVVSRGGEKINCQEVEDVAIRHPAIGAIAIVPMPDKVYDERACAFVIPAVGAEPVTVASLGAFLESQGVAKFKWPERVEIVDEFPMTSSGKLSKPMLRETIRKIIERRS